MSCFIKTILINKSVVYESKFILEFICNTKFFSESTLIKKIKIMISIITN